MEKIKTRVRQIPKKYLIIAAAILLTCMGAFTILINRSNKQTTDDTTLAVAQNPQPNDEPQQTPSTQTSESLAEFVPGNTSNTEAQFQLPTPVPPVKKDPITFTFAAGTITPNRYHGEIFNKGFADEWVWVSPSFETTGYTDWKFTYGCEHIPPNDQAWCNPSIQSSNDGVEWMIYKEGLSMPSGEYTYKVEHKYYRLIILSAGCYKTCERPASAQPYSYTAKGYFY